MLKVEEAVNKMGLIRTSLRVGIGIGIGYLLFHPNIERCQQTYQQKVTNVEQKYQSAKADENIVGPNEVNVTYLAADSVKGFVFSDRNTGEQGVIAKRPAFNRRGYNLEYFALENRVSSGDTLDFLGNGPKQSRPIITPEEVWTKLKQYSKKIGID